jgi:hypothetical protein
VALSRQVSPQRGDATEMVLSPISDQSIRGVAMVMHLLAGLVFVICVALVVITKECDARFDVYLPRGVKAVWDLDKAYRERTPTRERICVNGLWRWRPAENITDVIPSDRWGYLKVPGTWPGLLVGICGESHRHTILTPLGKMKT